MNFSVKPETSNEYSISLDVPLNSTFYDLMAKAAQVDKKFEFHYKTYKIGRFITSIGNNSQDEGRNLFCLLYEIPINEQPDKKYLSNYGVDVLRVKNNFRYLFWLQIIQEH